MVDKSTKKLSQLAKIPPKDKLYMITDGGSTCNLNQLVKRKIDLNNSTDLVWLINQVRSQQELPFRAEELNPILDFISSNLEKEWLTIYRDGLITLRVEANRNLGLQLFTHLIPLGFGLILLKDKPGFNNLVHKLNQPSYERLSSFLEAFTAARYAAAGYDIELEPKTAEEKSSDFRVRLDNEWIYFECKRINVEENLSVRKNRIFFSKLMHDLDIRFKNRIPEGYRIDMRLDRKPTSTQIQGLFKDLEQMISNGTYQKWVEQEYGNYALMPRAYTERPIGYPSRLMKITVGTTATPLSVRSASITISFNPFGSKLEQKFREVLKEAKEQIPSERRGIVIIQGLNEEKGMKILQERIGHPNYQNIIAGLAIDNGVYAVQRDDHKDVDLDFISKCVSYSLFYGYDIGNFV